jgi:tRNA (cytidine/uridine-2'-O-)-methyltransferase
MFNIALFEPNIPQNTGNIIRLSANNGCILHLIEPLGFNFEDKNLKRSGLDYFDLANVHRYPHYQAFAKAMKDHRIFAITTKGTRYYHEVAFQAGDVFLFGSETAGLSPAVHQAIAPENKLRVPMLPNNRSMNLSNTVAIITFEAWRQLGFNDGL